MKLSKSHYLFFVLGIILIAFSCSDYSQKDFEEKIPTLPEVPFEYGTDSGGGIFGIPFIYTDEQITLGRVLFYDKNLSLNNSVSCASCHKQQFGFADNKQFSRGVNVATTTRNSSHFANLNNYNSFFWDARSFDLNELIFEPIENHIEMRFDDRELLIERLEATSYYGDLFEAAYGTPEIDESKIASSIEAFLRNLNPRNSKFDQGRESDFDNFTLQELRGRTLFLGKAKCRNCHGGTDFSGHGSTANIGLEPDNIDLGAGEWSQSPSDVGTFKIPNLRNVALTSPYMHDGRFNSLREVLEHYNSNIQANPNLHWLLTEEGDIAMNDDNFSWWNPPSNGGTPSRLNLDEEELNDLEAFLNTLTDHSFVGDVRFSDPFK